MGALEVILDMQMGTEELSISITIVMTTMIVMIYREPFS